MNGSNTPASAAVDTAPRYDDSAWPLFVVELPPQRLAPEAFAAHLAVCSAIFERGEPFLMLVDASEHPSLLPSQRSAMTEAMRRDAERHPGQCLGLAIVLRSSFEKTVAHSIQSMSRAAHPFAIFATVAEARAWLVTKHEKQSGSAPAGARPHQPAALASRRSHSSAPPLIQMHESSTPPGRRSREVVPPPPSKSLEPAPPSSSGTPESSTPFTWRSRLLA